MVLSLTDKRQPWASGGTPAFHGEENMSGTSYQHLPWQVVAPEKLADGIERRMIIGDKLMACRLHFQPHVVTPVHTHTHEQMTFVLQGKVKFTIEGADRIVSAGDVLHFASNTPHGATMLDEEVVLIDVFTPLREEFLKE
jgi:quercetin dioxygenase-like cupin family protein